MRISEAKVFAGLEHIVLDDSMVEAVAYVLEKGG